ncbi:unnamed protein product [Parnassius mnemosyne]|uniref:C3H1-type domain-containing protein n=1 Tax=Parnassius mnemosyne TaxID=213953 RepID=A0AAV1LLK3_9NEOP
MEARINVFSSKCDHAIDNIKKLNMMAHGFVQQLNCEPAELKERFLNCMKQLDEFTYLITDFNLAINKLEATNSTEFAPVHDTSTRALPAPMIYGTFNLMDALTEPAPSTSQACPNLCPSEKPIRKKVPKEEQVLIAFSSASSSSESVPHVKNKTLEKEVQCKMVEDMNKSPAKINETVSTIETYNLPAQSILQIDQEYPAVILNVDGPSFWVITGNTDEVYNLINDMNEYYRKNFVELTLDQVMSLTYCACYDDASDCYYRGLFIRLTEKDMNLAEIFLVDTGEVQIAPIVNIQPLAKHFCQHPPYARCCHLAGIDLFNNTDKDLPEKLEEFLKMYISTPCSIEVDDNTSESLGVYVILPSRKILNTMLVEQGLASAIEKINITEDTTIRGPPEILDSDFNITDCPEYEDPVEAVTGYHNRDEMDICKHYKGGPENTCFKGARCNKKHIMKHPDGWTLDRVPVAGKCRPMPLPAPGTCLRVHVTHVAHYDRFYVQFVKPPVREEIPSFGVVLPPTTLERLVRDMNSPASRMAYKPLKMTPAPGELVAALYPLDDQWYRARVLSATRVDQNVEVNKGRVNWNLILFLSNQHSLIDH